jgi:hypothetical protein
MGDGSRLVRCEGTLLIKAAGIARACENEGQTAPRHRHRSMTVQRARVRLGGSTSGLTFDTGALLALERRHERISLAWRTARKNDVRITVPAAVVTEWWRGRSDLRDAILDGVDVEPLDRELAKLAGEALAAIKGATSIDAIVMASAARRGDIVYTSDVSDLLALQSFFPSVRVLHT